MGKFPAEGTRTTCSLALTAALTYKTYWPTGYRPRVCSDRVIKPRDGALFRCNISCRLPEQIKGAMQGSAPLACPSVGSSLHAVQVCTSPNLAFGNNQALLMYLSFSLVL